MTGIRPALKTDHAILITASNVLAVDEIMIAVLIFSSVRYLTGIRRCPGRENNSVYPFSNLQKSTARIFKIHMRIQFGFRKIRDAFNRIKHRFHCI